MTLTRALAGALLVVAFLVFQPLQRLDVWRAERAAANYYEAWASGNARDVCKGLSERQRETVASSGNGSCEEGFSRVAVQADPQAGERPRRVRVAGDRAKVVIQGAGELRLVRENFAWKVYDWIR